ncbi:MAG: 1-acyl-sn-glycerol-3-phosphate acyltransferase [Pirellulales bacterium]|nr:1-acyl-sn-glycerol-3-phosphate acyltransferase [Pirellulales bacterium]
MNRYPIGKPPKWWSPRPSRFWMRVWRRRRQRILQRQENVASVQINGLQYVRQAIEAEQGVLIVANHPTHADWLTIFEALDQLRQTCYVMTTWQVFQMAGPIVRLQYRQHGCFSIDRDGADRQAFRCSVDVLATSSRPLVIFPEGEVYHTADRVAPFREGPATIAQAAVKRSGRSVACVPCALRYRYSKSPLPELLDVMDRVEQKLELCPNQSMDLVERIYRAGDAATARLEREHMGESQSGQLLRERMPRLVQAILNGLDKKYGIETRRWSATERVMQLRNRVIVKRAELLNSHSATMAKDRIGHARDATEKSLANDSKFQELNRDVEKLFQAVQLCSYPSGYLSANPTLERIAETIDKLEEDVLGAETAGIRGVREAKLTFGEPILIDQPGDKETAISLTDTMHQRLQAMIDEDVVLAANQESLLPGNATSQSLNMNG